MTAFLQEYRPIFMALTFAFLGIAFYVSYRPGRAPQRSRIVTLNRFMLWAVTAVTIVFLFFPQAMTDSFATDDSFSPNMQRTVISIEGMT